jgi:hypothetical protein
MTLTFTHNNNEYTGELSQVQDAGDTAVYYLMIDNYYRGRLRLSAFDNRWIFDGEFADLAEGFGAWLTFIDWIKPEIDVNYKELFYFILENSYSNQVI